MRRSADNADDQLHYGPGLEGDKGRDRKQTDGGLLEMSRETREQRMRGACLDGNSQTWGDAGYGTGDVTIVAAKC